MRLKSTRVIGNLESAVYETLSTLADNFQALIPRGLGYNVYNATSTAKLVHMDITMRLAAIAMKNHNSAHTRTTNG